jgi:hypothetical protein
MVNRQIDAMAELQNAFSVLFKNWVLAVPTILVGIATLVIFLVTLGATLAPLIAGGIMAQQSDPSVVLAVLRTAAIPLLVFMIVAILLVLFAQAIVIGGAEHVWHGQPADLSGGMSKALGKLPALFGLFLIAVVLSFICSLLTLILIGPILGLVFLFFFMYALPAIVIGDEGPFGALGTSWRLVSHNIGPSALAFIGIVVVYILGGLVELLFQHLAILGHVVNVAVSGLLYAFAALVIVRFYDLLRAAPPQPTTTP